MLTTLAATAPYWHGGMPSHGFPVFPVILLLLVIGALVFGVLRRGAGRAIADARSVLADRFARGEIDAEEYRARRSELNRK
ncbi:MULTISPECIES: SHOCT domain-containing protein [unclassified Curtobacterium]|uniref:SHOCT domain-containing protein n=1 Tax=unclassified Curtobacterium TaxID=257496 RepID=UPI0021AD0E2C|nr:MULTISPECIES: SHOCT domain-containing protein [unclassified Curtobacterium]